MCILATQAKGGIIPPYYNEAEMGSKDTKGG